MSGLSLLTRDPVRYRTYFPKLRLIAPSPAGPWTKFDGNPVIKAGNGVTGPGHCSVTDSPDGKEMFVAYHRHGGKENKERLATYIMRKVGIRVNPDSLFDVHIKRIHEYKRQLLNVLHIIYDYLCLADDGVIPAQARTYLFSGKAAPGYYLDKQIIRSGTVPRS